MDKELLKVLLVDDDEDDHIITGDLLAEIEDVNFDLDWVETYDGALDQMRRNCHDVYLLDYRLGEHTGLELLQEALREGCNTPMILLTGQGDHGVDIEAMKAGAADYLVKGRLDAPILGRSIRYAIERKKTEEQIMRMAYYDNLTNLPNRVLFKERMLQVFSLAQRYGRLAALLYLDLDNFKRINDTLGHSVGDLLLKEVSTRLMGCVRKSDTVARQSERRADNTIARLGGDEFIILLSEIRYAQDAAKVAQRVLDDLNKPFLLDGHEVFISASIGITLLGADGDDTDSLLKNADTAMYSAKYEGKGNYQFYKKAMNASALEKLTLENDLRKAIEHEEFLLYYQPKMDLDTGRVTGFEALLRWMHPDKGMVSPDDFIPVAEEAGLMIPIGEWVLNTACAQNRAWQSAGLPPVGVAVNISGQQLKHRNFKETVTRALDQSGLAPQYLELEITENIVMHNEINLMTMLIELREMGVELSMDDFGTGYSSFGNIKQFPLNVIKIDRSFINSVTTNPDNKAIVTAIMAMAHSLSLRVIAEGVETEEQLTFLSGLGCDEMQGYLLSRPLPAEEIPAFMKEYSSRMDLGPNCGGGSERRPASPQVIS